jgi:hypothetical protein
MKYTKGDRVRHPIKNEWGLGEVLEDSRGSQVRIFFVEAGEKTLDLNYVEPEKVSGEEAKHRGLDNLSVATIKGRIKYQSLPQSIERFLERFPEGFNGKRFLTEERNYKVKAHELALELMGREQLSMLLGGEDYHEICIRALKVVNATNLMFPNEKMALKDGLDSTEKEQAFSKSLFQLLYGEGELEGRFMAFAKVLEDLGADKWTTASYFLFILIPEKYMFVKPMVTKNAAEISAIELNYRPQLNWLTYKSVLEFSEYLRSALAELKPRDMIDVQSFMWCISPYKP